MSKVVITTAITVDGLSESPAPRPYGWLVLEGESAQAQFDVFRDAAGMLLGRTNSEGFARYARTGGRVLGGEGGEAQFDVFRDAAGMLLGRKNYEGFASYWPTAAGDGRWADR